MTQSTQRPSLTQDSDELALDYERLSLDRQFQSGKLLIGKLVIVPGERVLDVGCGTGLLAQHIADLVGPTGSVLGVDPLPLRIELAQAKARPNLQFKVADAYDLSSIQARERIEGVKETIKGSKIELVDVRADDIDQTRAKRNVEDTITARPEINCMVGFYSYNTPRIYEALKEAGKIGKVTIIGFDEDPITLGGVKEGTIVGTVVQQPYEWGYQGMKDMAKYLEGDKSFIPANKLIIVPTKIIDKSNVDAFWTELKARQGKN